MNEVKHTKLPWKLKDTRYGMFIDCEKNYCVASTTDRSDQSNDANAAFIVKAVNNHYTLTEQRDELLAALKDCVDDMRLKETPVPLFILDLLWKINKAEAKS